MLNQHSLLYLLDNQQGIGHPPLLATRLDILLLKAAPLLQLMIRLITSLLKSQLTAQLLPFIQVEMKATFNNNLIPYMRTLFEAKTMVQ